MIKKIISIFLLTLFVNNFAFASIQFNSVNLENDTFSGDYNSVWYINKQIIISTSKINKIEWWDLYLSKLGKIENLINSTQDTKTLDIMIELNNQKNINNRSIWNSNNIGYEIYKLIDLKIRKRIIELENEKYNNVIIWVNNPWIDKNEIKKVEDEIVNIQLKLLDSSKSILEKILKNINYNTNYEDNWNIKFNLDWNLTNFWKWKIDFNMPNYKLSNEKFDSELQSQINLLVEASMKWKESLKVQFSTFIDFIIKDSNIYLLMNKLKYSWIDKIDNTWELSKILEKMKVFATNNQFLKFDQNINWSNKTEKEMSQLLNVFKTFTISDINSLYDRWYENLKKPMFKVYKKSWNKYLILPSKEVCNIMMSAQNKIISTLKQSCSDTEYADFVKDIIKTWNLYIILWTKTNTIWFDLVENKEISLISKLDYSDTKIENIDIKITPKNKQFLWDYVELNFINWQKLNLILKSKNDYIDFSFKSLLNKDNLFSKIDYIWNFSKKFKTSFNLENDSFKWNFDYKKSWYDYNSSKIIEENYVYKWELTWALKDHRANWFNLDAYWKDAIKNQDIFVVKMKLINKIITWTTKVYDKNEEILNVVTIWKYDKDMFELNNKASFKNIFDTQTSKARDAKRISSLQDLRGAIEMYYQDVAEYPDIQNFNEIKTYIPYIPEDPLKNVEINGCKFGYIYEVWPDENWISNQVYKLSTCLEEDTFKIKNDWGTDNDRLEIWIVLKDWKYGEKSYINGYNNWIKQDNKATSEDKITMDLNFKYTWNVDNYENEISMDLFISKSDYMKFKLVSDKKRTKKNTSTIKIPTSIKMIDDLK